MCFKLYAAFKKCIVDRRAKFSLEFLSFNGIDVFGMILARENCSGPSFYSGCLDLV